MNDEEALDLLDEAAVRLCAGYGKRSSPALVIRVLENGDVRLIGQELPANIIADLLRSAAGIYESQAAPTVRN